MADGGCHTFVFAMNLGWGKNITMKLGAEKKRCRHIFQAALQLNFAAG